MRIDKHGTIFGKYKCSYCMYNGCKKKCKDSRQEYYDGLIKIENRYLFIISIIVSIILFFIVIFFNIENEEMKITIKAISIILFFTSLLTLTTDSHLRNEYKIMKKKLDKKKKHLT